MNGNGTKIFPPLKVRGKEYSIGRMLRFIIGLAILAHAGFCGPYTDWKILGLKVGVGLLLVDWRLALKAIMVWKAKK